MAPFGHIILLGLTTEPLHLPYFPVVVRELSIHGACSSTPAEFDAMLEFAAKKDVRPIMEEFSRTEEGVKGAIGKLDDERVRYRAVLVN
ncbi:hypothetical protein EK21DRAFT_71348 [Setomelanomma holmii]|uniref:Alcohol dehydrogenase n=1 Tax=Setomelanomma holmii TaxID=210430 RepID=A0A9P4LL44_9PLEO|nr:hypothetical protein EK21DRAFT_71348 [Setomelanomma holmii]